MKYSSTSRLNSESGRPRAIKTPFYPRGIPVETKTPPAPVPVRSVNSLPDSDRDLVKKLRSEGWTLMTIRDFRGKA